MTCGGSGRLPCTCGAEAYRAGGRDAPCSCDRRCEGCPECKPADDAAERAARHGRLSEWYHAQAGTAPPRARGEAKAAKAETDRQGRMF